MKFRNFKVFHLVAIAAMSFFASCDKNEVSEQVPIAKNQDFVPQKGDSLPKIIFETRVDFSEEEGEVLASSENNEALRALDASGVGNFGYIYNIMASSTRKNTAPDSYTHEGYTYYKLNVDLNEKAGGNWIYLYYARTQVADKALCAISVPCRSTRIYETELINNWQPIGKDRTGWWVDLNEKAGGKWIYLSGKKQEHFTTWTYTPIKDIMVVSFKSAQESDWYNGMERVSCDLNEGTKGKFIYLYVKR